MNEEYSIEAGGVTCPVTVLLPDAPNGRWVLYLHGGGLLYGSRDDLPNPYVSAFLDAGYALACPDYPLAPTTPLPSINAAVLEIASQANKRLHGMGFGGGWYAFGRSAGAYLALRLTATLDSPHGDISLEPPLGVISFYGYTDLTAPFLTTPSEEYAALAPVSEETVAVIAGDEPTTSGGLSTRYALYVYARQKGVWATMLGLDRDSAAHESLSQKEIGSLPPIFLAASTGDKDVPYGCSKRLFRMAPRAMMVNAYGLPHDFDRDLGHSEGMEAYAACLEWMKLVETDSPELSRKVSKAL